MQVIINESEYKNLCDIRSKFYEGAKTSQIYFSKNQYYCHGYSYSNDEAFNKLIDINHDLNIENTKLQKDLDYYKNRNFWNKFKDLWKD